MARLFGPRALGTPALAVAAAIGAYSLALRPSHLRWGATDSEVARRWPGDELVQNPSTRAVRAVTVNAPAASIWPWIMQVGRERGGFFVMERKMMLTIKRLAEASTN
jgi:hypothetical protein